MKCFILFCLFTLFTNYSNGEQLNECWPLKLSTVCRQLSLQCIDSKQCGSNQICCRHECGTTCLMVQPINRIHEIHLEHSASGDTPSNGCPPPITGIPCTMITKECQQDSDCKVNNRICCNNGCGTSCR